MKFILSLIIFCLGSWGLTVGFIFPEYIWEILLGMLSPLIVGVIAMVLVINTHKTNRDKLTAVMSIAFIVKLVIYGLYVLMIIGYFHFESIPFIVSFAGYFTVLHILEALYLRTLFNLEKK